MIGRPRERARHAVAHLDVDRSEINKVKNVRWSHVGVLPDALRALQDAVLARAARLDSGARRLLEALSVISGVSIEEIDALTGPAIGRAKSATFRTMSAWMLSSLILASAMVDSKLHR